MADNGFVYDSAGLWLQDNIRISSVTSITPPAITAKIGAFQPTWMDMPIPVDNGMEAMQLEFKVSCDRDVLALFGMVPGGKTRAQVRRNYLDLDETMHTWVDEFEEIIGTVTPDEHGNDSKDGVGMSVTMNLSYYKLTADNVELIEINPRQMIRSVNGVNQLAARKDALLM